MGTSALFGAKTFKFFKIYVMSARTKERGLSSADILQTNGEGSIFHDFVRTSFMENSLILSQLLYYHNRSTARSFLDLMSYNMDYNFL